MNQTTNLIQWKNLTTEQKVEHDFENYKYEYQEGLIWVPVDGFEEKGSVYRLKIEPDKWYAIRIGTDHMPRQGRRIGTGDGFDMLRPAKPSEIPKPERVFKDGAFYPVVLSGDRKDVAQYSPGYFQITISHEQWDESNFVWIGEELKIEWGKS